MVAELAAGAMAIAAFVFLWVLKGRDQFKLAWLVKGVLALIGGFSLAATSVGAWLAGWIVWGADLLGQVPAWLGFDVVIPGAVLTTIAVVALAFIGLYGLLKDHTYDKPEAVAFIIGPLVALAAMGPIADAMNNDVGPTVREAGSSTIGRMIGG